MELATWMRTRTCRSRWPRAPRAGHRPPGAQADRPLKPVQLPVLTLGPAPLLTRTASFSRVGVDGPTLLAPCGWDAMACVSHICVFLYICPGSLDPFGFINTRPLQGLV